MCVSDCSEEDYYQYEFKYTCYHECILIYLKDQLKIFFEKQNVQKNLSKK